MRLIGTVTLLVDGTTGSYSNHLPYCKVKIPGKVQYLINELKPMKKEINLKVVEEND